MRKKNKIRTTLKSDNSEYVLAYSTDPEPARRCVKCAKAIVNCICANVDQGEKLSKIKPIVQMEKQGRSGKAVTVVKRLPTEELFLKDLCANLKRSLGSGGTYYIDGIEGVIEIQGDKRKGLLELVKDYISKK